jgi:hypothetical protein
VKRADAVAAGKSGWEDALQNFNQWLEGDGAWLARHQLAFLVRPGTVVSCREGLPWFEAGPRFARRDFSFTPHAAWLAEKGADLRET